MKSRFPVERTEKRQTLLRMVESVREVLAAGANEGEELRTLPSTSVAALRDSGLLLLKTPAALGGAEADPVTQLDIIEAVSYIDPAAGWCFFIGAAGMGMAGAFLADAVVAQMFSGDHIPTVAGAVMPGSAVPVPGGYRVTGRWSWASGIRHAEWVLGNTLVIRDPERPPELRAVYFPIQQVEVHDNWQVMGMKGTGSCDFSVSDLFVPEDFTYDFQTSPPRRGGPLYRLGFPGFVINEPPAFALGVARRALDEIIDLARSKRRGYSKQTSLAERAVFQRAIAEGDLKLRAARALMVEVLEKAWTIVNTEGQAGPALQAEMRSAATLVTDVALEVTTNAFRYGGGTAVFLPHILQRCLRDLYTAASHLTVSDISYENYGQFLLGLPSADPMN